MSDFRCLQGLTENKLTLFGRRRFYPKQLIQLRNAFLLLRFNDEFGEIKVANKNSFLSNFVEGKTANVWPASSENV